MIEYYLNTYLIKIIFFHKKKDLKEILSFKNYKIIFKLIVMQPVLNWFYRKYKNNYNALYIFIVQNNIWIHVGSLNFSPLKFKKCLYSQIIIVNKLKIVLKY